MDHNTDQDDKGSHVPFGGRETAGRRWLVTLLALAMALFGAITPSAGSASAASTQRVAGSDRYATSVVVARLVGGGSLTGLDRLILATGERFPDALAVVTATGYGYTRPDSVVIIPTATLGP